MTETIDSRYRRLAARAKAKGFDVADEVHGHDQRGAIVVLAGLLEMPDHLMALNLEADLHALFDGRVVLQEPQAAEG